MIRVLSLWQPWATLHVRRVNGEPLKPDETRDWRPNDDVLNTWVAIHAAKQPYRPADYPEEFRAQLLQDEIDAYRLPYGAVVGFVKWDAFVPTEEVIADLSTRSELYGNYAPDRYAWHAIDSIELATAIPMTGRQGFFHWSEGSEVLNQNLRLRRAVSA